MGWSLCFYGDFLLLIKNDDYMKPIISPENSGAPPLWIHTLKYWLRSQSPSTSYSFRTWASVFFWKKPAMHCVFVFFSFLEISHGLSGSMFAQSETSKPPANTNKDQVPSRRPSSLIIVTSSWLIVIPADCGDWGIGDNRNLGDGSIEGQLNNWRQETRPGLLITCLQVNSSPQYTVINYNVTRHRTTNDPCKHKWHFK